ncbi:DNA primase (plasmid) [Pseudomonas aeruginosa]|nr:DNA primase [Stutzerimonas stutzeri]MBS9726452.1 DNA primase [Stutzerimonas stutzeri]QYG43718.1 DNA primase [Pseudomonas aeruginosa]
MIRVDFDKPTYLRASLGLAILSPRSQHLLPGADDEVAEPTLEPVVINRLFNGRAQVNTDAQTDAQSEIRGELIPFKPDDSDDQEIQSSEKGVELSFGGIAGKSVTGLYGGSGHAPYRFNKKNGPSFFLRVGEHLIWGVELAPEIRRSGAEKGVSTISVTFMGKQPVTVLKKANVKNGQPEDEWVNTHKNLWEVRKLS